MELGPITIQNVQAQINDKEVKTGKCFKLLVLLQLTIVILGVSSRRHLGAFSWERL